MLSNIHQNFDGLLVEVKLPMAMDHNNESQPNNDIADLPDTTKTLPANNNANAEDRMSPSSFIIYDKDINFHENFQSTYKSSSTKSSNTTLSSPPPLPSPTKDRPSVVDSNSAEPNHLLNKTINNNTNNNNNNDNSNNNNNINAISIIRADIHDVHNYSKTLQSREPTPGKDTIADFRSDENYTETDTIEMNDKATDANDPLAIEEDRTMPEHHARRPMNAFLIFCKRHRAIVREKYPNLENRSITKILGDWWASLDESDKTCYTSLAKQYKDAFFSANPNFKWYKLPAPPLRTLSTRPTNMDRPAYLSTLSYPYVTPYDIYMSPIKDVKPVRPKNDYVPGGGGELKSNQNQCKKHRGANMGMFKLADEAQMGSLSSLMVDPESKTKIGNNNLGEIEEDPNESKRIIHQKILSESTGFFDTPTESVEPFSNMRNHATKMQSEMDGNVPKIKEENKLEKQLIVGSQPFIQNSLRSILLSPRVPFIQVPNKIVHSVEKMDIGSDADVVGVRKASRACKGKRYLEFMSSGKISPVTKKSKFWSTSLTADLLTGPNGFYNKKNDLTPIKTEYNSHDHLYANLDGSPNYRIQTSDASTKLFDASDFDLEDKIKSLPALSLDKYLTKKRETKKKKKINQKRGGAGTAAQQKEPQTIQEARERIQNSMVGSQKRKARKESITRRDVISMSTEFMIEENEIDNKEELKEENDNEVEEETKQGGSNSDLFILASLAEVAATYEVE